MKALSISKKLLGICKTLAIVYSAYICLFIGWTILLLVHELGYPALLPLSAMEASSGEVIFKVVSALHVGVAISMGLMYIGILRLHRRRDRQSGDVRRRFVFPTSAGKSAKALAIYVPWWNCKYLDRLFKESAPS